MVCTTQYGYITESLYSVQGVFLILPWASSTRGYNSGILCRTGIPEGTIVREDREELGSFSLALEKGEKEGEREKKEEERERRGRRGSEE